MPGPGEARHISSIVDCAEADVPNCWRQLLESARVPDPELSDLLFHLTNYVWCLGQGNRKIETLEVRASSFKSIDEACAATAMTQDTWYILKDLQKSSPVPLDENLRPSFDHLRSRSFPTPGIQEVGIRCSIRTLILDRLSKFHNKRTTETLNLRRRHNAPSTVTHTTSMDVQTCCSCNQTPRHGRIQIPRIIWRMASSSSRQKSPVTI